MLKCLLVRLGHRFLKYSGCFVLEEVLLKAKKWKIILNFIIYKFDFRKLCVNSDRRNRPEQSKTNRSNNDIKPLHRDPNSNEKFDFKVSQQHSL